MVHRDEGAGFGGTGFGDQVRRFGGSGLSRALASGSGGHAGGAIAAPGPVGRIKTAFPISSAYEKRHMRHKSDFAY
jgi:hypothetical protein